MRNLTLFQKFNFLTLAALVVFCVVFGWIVTTAIEYSMISSAKKTTSMMVADQALKEFQANELSTPQSGSKHEAFRKRIDHISFGPNIDAIKIWNRNMVIVWADKKELVGRQFPDNQDLKKALAGTVVSKIAKPRKKEHYFEKSRSRRLELYIPLKFEPNGNIHAVFEIYQNLDPLYAEILFNKKFVWGSAVSIFAILHSVLFFMTRKASNHIEMQTKELRLSEEKHRNLVQSAKDGIISTDREGNVVLFNYAAEEMFGYSADEIRSRSLEVLVPEKYREKHRSGVRLFLKTEKQVNIGKTSELEGVRRDGRTFPMELSLSTSGEPDNLLVTAIIRDVSNRKQAEEELTRRLEQQGAVAALGQTALEVVEYHKLVEKAIVVVANQLEVDFCDVLKILPGEEGFRLQSGLGRKKENTGHTLGSAGSEPLARYTLQSNEAIIVEDFNLEHRFRGSGLDQENWFVSGISVTIQGQGRPFGVLGAYTKRRRTFSKDDGFFLQAIANVLAAAIERQRVETLRQEHEHIALSREKLARIGEISAGVAHTIRNPLYGVISGMEMFLKKLRPDDTVARKNCALMMEGLDRIERVTNRLLTLAREGPLQTVATDIRYLVMDTLKFVEERVHRQNIPVLTELADLPAVQLDADRFAEALINLIDNALDACREGGRITLRCSLCEEQPNGVNIWVEDTGTGISAKHLARVFDPFFTTKSVGEGSGLGLAIARRIVEEHGGRLSLESFPGTGTTVRIFLPFKNCEASQGTTLQ